MIDLLDDHAALAAWEQLRVSRRALDLRGLAARCAMDNVDALRALDRLSAHGLVARVAATNRRGIRWRVTCDRIVVAFDPHEERAASDLHGRLNGSRSDLVRDAIARFGTRQPEPGRTCGRSAALTVRLDPQDLPEFTRRIQAVFDFLELVGKRVSGGSRAAPNYSNHAVHLGVEPLAGPVLPQPSIDIVPRAEAGDRLRASSRTRGARGLSPRERDVAEAMARGITRPAIARSLGVSANTVGTLSLRIYRKLGVRTRLELAHAMRALEAPRRGDAATTDPVAR